MNNSRPSAIILTGGENESQAAEVFRFAGAQVELEECRRGEEIGDGVLAHERADDF